MKNGTYNSLKTAFGRQQFLHLHKVFMRFSCFAQNHCILAYSQLLNVVFKRNSIKRTKKLFCLNKKLNGFMHSKTNYY
jgi:hypothetical protein